MKIDLNALEIKSLLSGMQELETRVEAEYEYDDMKEMPMSPEFYSLQDKLGNLL